MILALMVFLLLVFVALCLIGLLTLVKQAITDRPLSTPHAFIQDRMPAAAALSPAVPSAAAPSENAERGARGESCA